MTMPRQLIVDFVEGDDAPDWPVRFVGLTLSDYTSITMRAKKGDGTKFSRVVTPDGTDDELGWVVFEAGDLTRGRHYVEFEFIQSDTRRFTVPRKNAVILDVRADLG